MNADASALADDEQTPWWGAHQLERGERAYLCIGPLELGLERLPHEWRVWHVRSADPIDERLALETPSERSAPADAEHARFGFAEEPDVLLCDPVLADRPVVLRPETPLFVPAKESIEIFASTPVFLRADFRNDDSVELELPTFRMSDTWFGPTTTEGELCYASRTHAQLSADLLKPRPHRAITQITIKNGASESLPIERLKLPVQSLGVYRGVSSALWTETVTFRREATDDNAAVSIGSRPPAAAGDVTQLGKPRTPARDVVARVFDALLLKEAPWSL